MPPKLSTRTQELIGKIFAASNQGDAIVLLEDDCGNNIPFCEEYDEYKMERIRFAALKLSEGKLDKLIGAIDLAQTDWRDVLVAAGFGSDLSAHETWANKIIKT